MLITHAYTAVGLSAPSAAISSLRCRASSVLSSYTFNCSQKRAQKDTCAWCCEGQVIDCQAQAQAQARLLCAVPVALCLYSFSCSQYRACISRACVMVLHSQRSLCVNLHHSCCVPCRLTYCPQKLEAHALLLADPYVLQCRSVMILQQPPLPANPATAAATAPYHPAAVLQLQARCNPAGNTMGLQAYELV